MENPQQRRYAKGEYDAELRQKAKAVHDEVRNNPNANVDALIESIYKVLKEATLRSWNAGIRVGKREALTKKTASVEAA